MLATSAGDILFVHGPKQPVYGEVRVPGDKSISHRAVMLGSIAEGTMRIRNFLPATDCLATIDAIRALGVQVEVGEDEVRVHGRGLHGLREPVRPIDCGGSGTSMRLLAGLLAGQSFYSVLIGNAQLSRRPMGRVVEPLRKMGATILGREGGKYPPLSMDGGKLKGLTYTPPMSSAQVKSAVLLAGLYAEGTTTVVETLPTRDHTERMLKAMGARLQIAGGSIMVEPRSSLSALEVNVPGDISSAAFPMVAASILPGSQLFLPSIGVNPGRTGIMLALRRMGGDVRTYNERLENGESVADLEVAYAPLRGIRIAPEEVPSLIDELPILVVAATQAEGVTEVRGAGELRVKETDRIATTVTELRKMGAHIEALPDGFRVEGPTRLRGAVVSSHEDHRLAMALAVAGLVAEGETVVEGARCTEDSFPSFAQVLGQICAGSVRS